MLSCFLNMVHTCKQNMILIKWLLVAEILNPLETCFIFPPSSSNIFSALATRTLLLVLQTLIQMFLSHGGFLALPHGELFQTSKIGWVILKTFISSYSEHWLFRFSLFCFFSVAWKQDAGVCTGTYDRKPDLDSGPGSWACDPCCACCLEILSKTWRYCIFILDSPHKLCSWFSVKCFSLNTIWNKFLSNRVMFS